MRTSADKLTAYEAGLRAWLKLKRKHEANAQRPEPSRLKPLPEIPNPIQFELDANDGWVKKTYNHVMKAESL